MNAWRRFFLDWPRLLRNRGWRARYTSLQIKVEQHFLTRAIRVYFPFDTVFVLRGARSREIEEYLNGEQIHNEWATGRLAAMCLSPDLEKWCWLSQNAQRMTHILREATLYLQEREAPRCHVEGCRGQQVPNYFPLFVGGKLDALVKLRFCDFHNKLADDEKQDLIIDMPRAHEENTQ